MDVRILGPLEVLGDGHPIALGGGRQRALLALLVLERNRTVSGDRIVDELWNGDAPATAGKVVQNLVSQLRRGLPADDVLRTRREGYELALPDESLDAARFERLLEEGRRELEAGEPERAAATLREALALWRGPALGELAGESWATAESARLEERRVVAFERRVDADLALGRHADLVGELEAAVAREPLREGLRAQLMLALYRSGRQAEALAAYADARHTLVAELGIEPGPALTRLHAARGVFLAVSGTPTDRLPPEGAAFVKRFSQTQPGETVEAYAVYAAHATEILLDAIERSDGSRAGAIEALFRTDAQDGLTGAVHFDARGDIVQGAVTILRVTDGGTSHNIASVEGADVERITRLSPELVDP